MIPDAVVMAALETVLKSIGTSIKHYMPASKADAMEAMRGVLQAERERAAGLIEAEIAKREADAVGTLGAAVDAASAADRLRPVLEAVRGEAA